MTREHIKQRAKEQLGLNIFGSPWMLAVAALVIQYAISYVTGAIIPGIGAILILGPIAYGVSYLFLKQSRDGAPMKIGDMFCGFTDDFGQTFLIGLMTSLFIALWSMLFAIPGIIKGYAYSMAYFIKIDNPTYNWRSCISASQDLMYGHKAELFMLDLSFIGWYIVGSLCLGIGTLWVAPYHMAARAQFYNAIRYRTV